MEHVRIHITGIVQGVGMRPFVYREAVARGITGWVLNAGDGVHVEAHGEAPALKAFERALRDKAPAAASVTGIAAEPLAEGSFDPRDLDGFRIIASEDDTARTTFVSPDIATCPDCLRELFDPADRRYHYPFINCTNCGPRFTIIRSLPYDRASTSMDAFPMCPACAREYADPLDRRFHAQPDACFECGPHLTWRCSGDADSVVGRTREESDAIVARCAELLAGGGIVAIKGLGGFHLACDAGNDAAVRELRRRKRRSNKPLAIMVQSLEDAKTLCEVDPLEQELLTGTVRPIVLLRRHPADGRAVDLAHSVAFDLPELGIMLPYTPLQHLLLAACAEHSIRALVMTSGNTSEEPIEIDDGRAWERLVAGGLADALLGNDRAILSRYDDSVVRVVDGATQMVRRARGYAPRPIELPKVGGGALRPSTLACGPEQKATIALTRERQDSGATCFLTQHIGDVENGATFDAWHATRARFEELFDLQPAALACDLHPRYLPSQWAREQARSNGMPLVQVQHHHAHITSVIAEAAVRGEHDVAAPVIGIALDGTGAGARVTGDGSLEPDGTIWGGEFLVASLTGFTRAAHIKAWRLPGGAASVRDPRRNAFALLHTYDLLAHPGARPLLDRLTEEERAVTRVMVERGINSPLTSSMGRFLDAIAALLGICDHATYEGEPAILLEATATGRCRHNQKVLREKMVETARYVQTESPDFPYLGSRAATTLQKSAHNGPLCRNQTIIAESDPSISCDTLYKSGTFYQFSNLNSEKPIVIDYSRLLVHLLDGIVEGKDAGELARDAHDAVIDAVVGTARAIAAKAGVDTAALSGGVFMNRLLLSGIRRGLEREGLHVLLPLDIPFNDGCIAYGQAAVARAQLSASG